MKILYYFAEQKRYMDQWQRVHIFDELERNGHIISVFNPLKSRSIDESNLLVIEQIKKSKKKYNLFMTCVGSEYLYPETVSKIKALGLPTLLICFDNLHAPYMHKKIAPEFDLVWLTSFETENKFKNWGCNTIFLPYAANPHQFSPQENTNTNCVCFIGTPYGSRTNKLNVLLEAGIDCNIYTNYLNEAISNNNSDELLKFSSSFLLQIIQNMQFSIGRKMIYAALLNKYLLKKNQIQKNSEYLHIMPSVPFKELAKIYHSSSLSLNITELRNTYVLKKPLHKLHLRTFEIPMSGGLQFVSYNKELSNYFKSDSEIVFYGSNEEFIEKAQYYTDKKNEKTVSKMKINARKRAENEHTWMKRFNKIFNYFEI